MYSVFIIPTDHWSSPKVSGDQPPPVDDFTLSKLADEKVLLFGGYTPLGLSSELRIATIHADYVVSVCYLK